MIRRPPRSTLSASFPTRRSSDLEGVRGSDEFVRVSWDEAYKLIHEQHMRIRKEYGPASVFAGSYGWRSSGHTLK